MQVSRVNRMIGGIAQHLSGRSFLLADFAETEQQGAVHIEVKAGNSAYLAEQAVGGFVTHVQQLAAVGAFEMHVTVTVLTVDELVGGFAAAAFGEAGDEVFVHELWHQAVECAFAGRAGDVGVSLHAGCDCIDGKGAVLVLFEESEELTALLGLVGHRKICLSAMFCAWNLTL